MQNKIDAAAVVELHDRQLRTREWPVLSHIPVQPGVWQWIDANHRYNGLRWREEERVCRLEIAADEIAAGKRLIDRYRQKRKDAAEAIDENLLAGMHAAPGDAPPPGARLSSETPGALVDRLSTLALTIHHMRAQTLRSEAGIAHVRACSARLERLLTQRLDLMSCLDALLADARAGRAYFKLYRQCALYDDPVVGVSP